MRSVVLLCCCAARVRTCARCCDSKNKVLMCYGKAWSGRGEKHRNNRESGKIRRDLDLRKIGKIAIQNRKCNLDLQHCHLLLLYASCVESRTAAVCTTETRVSVVVTFRGKPIVYRVPVVITSISGYGTRS